MGYTHYWTQRRGYTAEQWEQICEDVAVILKDAQHVQGIALGDGVGEVGSSPVISGGCIHFNGIAGDSHETFKIYRKRPKKEPYQSRCGSDFCKTARKPYDLAVTAILCYLATVAESHSVSSDGHGKDWIAGLEEAKRALPRYSNVLDIPRPILEDDRWCPPWAHHFTAAYNFRFCVDGRAYIIRERDGAAYCFLTHKEAAVFARKHEHILIATGFFDARRRNSLRAKQNALFRRMVEAAPIHGCSELPPAYVRPSEMPPLAQQAYSFKDLLELGS